MERYIAIDNVCAWPNLTLLPSGEIVATIFNQPCHGKWEGDVECWASADGRFWQRRGVPAPHEPGTNRMNVAAGLANNGDLVVLASGWSHRLPVPEPLPVSPHDPLPEGYGNNMTAGHFGVASPLPVWVCRSSDGGRTWTRKETLTPPEGLDHCIPFGNCIPGTNDTLHATVYGASRVWFARSLDDGRTWSDYSLIDEGLNETDILSLGDGNWLAAARSVRNLGLQLYRSADDGRTWVWDCALTTMQQHPGHLLRLKDGRILLSFGVRNVGLRGVGMRGKAAFLERISQPGNQHRAREKGTSGRTFQSTPLAPRIWSHVATVLFSSFITPCLRTSFTCAPADSVIYYETREPAQYSLDSE
jgi:hypothetical protein